MRSNKYLNLTIPLVTPANGVLLSKSRNEALRQPTGLVQFAWNDQDPFLYNRMFDENLISFDENYCSVVNDIQGLTTVPTLSYLPRILESHLAPNPVIIDIGCGQGEFVKALRKSGVDAIGYDPVLRRAESFLHPEYWSPAAPPADLYVMRCVLPHIPDPWNFLQLIAESSPRSLVLIEFQRLEWIIENDMWYQIGHGHVNFLPRSTSNADTKSSIKASSPMANGGGFS